MNDWLTTGIHQVNAFLGTDADFQALTQQLTVVHKDYLAITEKLSPKERELIEDYIALCEEVEYQRTLAAYSCAKQNGPY